MKVKELIEILEQCNPDATVIYEDSDDEFVDFVLGIKERNNYSALNYTDLKTASFIRLS